MNLKFPPLSGGVNQGLNDAGIETFEGDYAHYVVRECTQNSLDAAASHVTPVRMEITWWVLPTQDLPFMPQLRDVLDRCETYWSAHPRPSEFFRKAGRCAARDDVVLLKISDFGTTGVPGNDEDNNRPWFGLVRWRRTDAGELADEELYCSDAQWCGLYDRMHTHEPDETQRRSALADQYGEPLNV